MWRACIVGGLLIQKAWISHALPQVREGVHSWTGGPSLPASSTTANHSIADVELDQATLSRFNQSARQSTYLSDSFMIPGTDLVADIALFSRLPLSYVEVVSVLQLAVDDIQRHKSPDRELRTVYKIDDKGSGIDTSFFIRSGIMLTPRYLTYQEVVKVINDGLLKWVQKRVEEREGLYAFSFRVFSNGERFVFADGAVDKSIKTA